MSSTAIPCKYCNEMFYDMDEHERHLKLAHHKVPVFVCKICNEGIKGTDNFDKHLQFTHGTNHWDLNLGLKQPKRMIRDMTENY